MRSLITGVASRCGVSEDSGVSGGSVTRRQRRQKGVGVFLSPSLHLLSDSPELWRLSDVHYAPAINLATCQSEVAPEAMETQTKTTSGNAASDAAPVSF